MRRQGGAGGSPNRLRMRVLVDTSVWINHLHRADPDLIALLRESLALMHPSVLGELACGSIPNRQEFLSLWLALPPITEASFEEALLLLEKNKLWGRGLGWTDIHLLASALVSGTMLWTRDRLLRDTARQLRMALKL
jgi:predicted nucleic acid-binding protein